MCKLSGEPLIQLEAFTTPETHHLYGMENPPLNKLVAQGREPQSAYQVRGTPRFDGAWLKGLAVAAMAATRGKEQAAKGIP